MAKVIAGVYEIQEKIGSGGGGVVYLGRHLRLDKAVVLKADKRSLTTKPETLRREVDMLKSLSHTYIPQVYDFVQEDGIVYTVMDYIEGESLDKILKRGLLPPQPQLIQWACQVLEALVYLHGQPPYGILHADIKPSNIILRRNGDICLIDYNIALALGEDGAVKAGYSAGYASPEHYGSESVFEANSLTGSRAGRNPVMLDVRSDIYSLGATLYHLVSGVRPAQDSDAIKPLTSEQCSPAVAKIIQKAMSKDPAKRYQSAAEMLEAFRELYTCDKRVLRRTRRMRISAVLSALVFLTGGFSTYVGLRQQEQRQEALTLAGYSADELAKGNVSGAVSYAMQAIPQTESIFHAPVTPQARKALTDALQVYDLSDKFRPLDVVELPAAPYEIRISPDGSRFAVLYQSEAAIYDTESRTCLVKLPVIDSAQADIFFTDSAHIVYAGNDGVTCYDLERQKVVWTGGEAVKLALSGDKKTVAAVGRDGEKAVVYHMKDGTVRTERSFDGKRMGAAYNDIFANPHNRVLSLNEDGTMLAVSFEDGALMVYDLDDPENDLIMYDASDYTGFEGAFCKKYFAFTAEKSDQSLFGLIDTDEGVYVGELESRTPMHVRTDDNGIWLSQADLLVCFDMETLEDQEMAFTDQRMIRTFASDGNHAVVVTEDPGFAFFDSGANQMSYEDTEKLYDFVELSQGYAIFANRDQPSVRVMKLEDHAETTVLSYDARYRHDEARISHDGSRAMLFDYEGFRIYDRNGKKAAEGMFPDAEKIYDQQFRKTDSDSWLEVIWYDGTVRSYSAFDGAMMKEEKRDPPSKDLYEEFLTADYRFTSELHEPPRVYDLETGALVKELEKDSYLTYVTETEEYIMTEYVTADGERYGLLLDKELETLARLPDLCDLEDGNAVFDYQSGDLRQCRLYSLPELITLGEQYSNKKLPKGETR